MSNSFLFLFIFTLFSNLLFSASKTNKPNYEYTNLNKKYNRHLLKFNLNDFPSSRISVLDSVKTGEINGTVVNESTQLQEYIGVSLHRSNDSTLVKGIITDSTGSYRFLNILPGSYYIKATAIGFEDKYSDLINLKSTEVIVVPIILKSSVTTLLNTVQINSKITLVERKSDRFVIKVKESAVASGTSLELLKATPFVTLSNSNEVSLQGKHTLVLVDNKPIPDSSVESILQMIPAGNISSIELITNPSAKYDAIYGAVINIITKKGQKNGYTGNARISGAQGEFGQFGVNSSITYKKEKLTSFGTIGYQKFDQMSFNKTERIVNNAGVLNLNNEEITRLFYQNFYSIQGGIQYKLNENETIGALITSNPQQSTGYFNSKNEFSRLNIGLDSILFTDSNFNSKGATSNYNLNYHLVADSTKTELTVLTTYTPYRNKFNQYFPSYIVDGNGNVINVPAPYKTRNTAAIDIWISQLDFVRNFKKEWKLEAGLKNQITNSNSQIDYEEYQNGNYIKIPEFSNDSKLKEIVSAAYGILYKDWKKDKIQVGFRLENTNASYSGGSKQQFLKLFPTLYYEHNLNENYNFSLSYKKTISRTPYNEMVPYTIFVNQYTIFSGNPLLQPQYDDNISLNLNLKKLNISFNYASIKGMFGQFPISQDYNTGVTYFALQNLNKSSDFYIDVFYPLKITSWWDTQNSGTLFGYSKSKGNVLGNEFKLSSTWYNFKTDHSFTLSKSIKCQVIGNYSSALTSELTRIGVVGNIDAFVLINVLKKKGQIRIGATDILKRNIYTSDQYFNNYSSEKFRYSDSRRIGIGFTYNFGKLSNQTPEKELGNDDALRRIGQQ